MKKNKRTGVRELVELEGGRRKLKKKVLLPARRLFSIAVLLWMRLLSLVSMMSTVIVFVLVLITFIAVRVATAAAAVISSAIAVVL